MKPKPDTQTLSLILSGHLNEFDWGAFSEADWAQFNQRALLEGVAPLLYWSLSKSEMLPVLPAAARNFLRISYASTWMRNQKYLSELQNLSRLFARDEIPVILLKGICYVLTIYPDIGLRPMGDMDLLVPRPGWKKAVSLARLLDFEDTQPAASSGLNDLIGHDICLKKKGAVSISLELHHSLVADKTFTYAVPVDWFWEQSEALGPTATNSEFGNLLILSPTAQILYAASHAMLQHGGKDVPLCWYYDVDRLICHFSNRLDWEKLLSQAFTFEWGSALYAALTQTHSYFHTPIPGNVLEKLSAKTDRHSELVALKQTHPATHTMREFHKLYSLNWHGRLRLMIALVLPSPAYMMWRYGLKNPRDLIVQYPIRWWGIIKDGFRTVLALVKRSI